MMSLRPRTIAIIGAGPAGLVAAKYFRAEKAFDKISIFEQRSFIGGIWNYTPEDRSESLLNVPQTDPSGQNQDPVWRECSQNSIHDGDISRQNGVRKLASFVSPIYEKLESNIPRGLMGFQNLNWPKESQLFPKHETVLEYIKEYGKDVQDLVQFETQVVNVEEAESNSWKVTTRNLRSGTSQREIYDAVVVANGHFIVPYIPNIPGINCWNEEYPGQITHSKYFRNASEFTNKKVIVVGNSASGIDISSQIATVSQHPLLWSIKSTSMFQPMSDPRKLDLPPISKFHISNRAVEFEDGTIERDIDAVVFATGYFYSLPFLKDVKPDLIADGSHVQHTYQHLFYTPRPTLSFLALPQRIIPFPVSEAQSAVLARVFSGRLSLPPLHEMRKWEEKVIEKMGAGRNFHLLPFPKDGNYINELSNWALTAPPREGLENEGKGKLAPVWGEWEFWCRENFPRIRGAFGAKGEERHNIRTLEELGFVYEDNVKQVAREERLI
ncbi:FAD/NAD(P)-binding domain-containing protein [Zopfia rhizophila CBS 207.26]|uniref:FAD/NAD(P)-binding domain-containing protein n=1 Tax=Zopfia rhizophila CBS 207.26 TaxID=1314779 RepID=A0A6A6EPQ2_9PEZI|nr:FAD/NAD(P)-binding domain-containing protein [Zopfia rhizophila CBS 207.26]